MRLCFCADARSIHTLRWVSAFAKTDEIDLISFDYPDLALGTVTPAAYAAIGVRLHLVPRTFPGILTTPSHVKKIIRSLKPDLVHAHYLTQYGFCAAVADVHPLVVSCWGSDVLVDPKKNRLYRYMVEYALRHADIVTCDGTNYLGPLKKEFGVTNARIRLISHGVDCAVFHPVSRAPATAGCTVISVRGFRSIYDPTTLLRAIPTVLAAHPDTRFLLAGTASTDPKVIAATRGMENVTLLGTIPHEDLPARLAAADIYVSTSTSDGGMPVSTLEAMASGLPIIVTNTGDHSSLIVDDAGVVVPVGDPVRLAQAIIDLIDHPDRRVHLGITARKIAVARYDAGRDMDTMRQCYEELIAARAAGHEA